MGADDLDNLVQPGQVLAGKYRIDRILGKGGMGVVVSAHHIALDERVAIKFLLPAAVGKPELLSRFEREARAAIKIKSEHIARVLDVGFLETGAPYMVMEFLEGADLSQKGARDGAMPYPLAADYVLQACEAIVEAHALGIVHRDLKPANLFVARGADGLDSVKVLDFGISKSSAMGGSGGGDMTQTQSMLGSPYYMSPEQMQSARTVDARTDIWSLGVILYELVAGRVPFEADSLPELVLKIVAQPPPSLRMLRPDVDSGFEHVVMRCLEKDRERRFANLGELAAALVRFAPERSRVSADRVLRVVQTSGLGTSGARPGPNVALPGPGTVPIQAIALPANTGGAGTGSGRYVAYGAQVASSPPPGTPPPQPGSTPRLGATSDGASWGQTGASIPKTNGLAIAGAIAAACCLAVVAIGGIVYMTGHGKSAGGADAASSAVASAPPASVVPSAQPSATATTKLLEPIREPEPVDAGAPDAAPLVVKPVVSPISQPGPMPGPVPSPAPAGGPDCKIPYVVNAKGVKVFRPECVK